MSDLDLTEAVEAAEDALLRAAMRAGDDVRTSSGFVRSANAAVTAAAPLIEAQVRERVAQEILEWGQQYTCFTNARHAAQVAARITRGGAS